MGDPTCLTLKNSRLISFLSASLISSNQRVAGELSHGFFYKKKLYSQFFLFFLDKNHIKNFLYILINLSIVSNNLKKP